MNDIRRFRTRSRASSSVGSSVIRASLAAEARDWHDSFLEDPIMTIQVPLSDIPEYVLTTYGDSHPALSPPPQRRRTWYGRRVSNPENMSGTLAVRMRSSEYARHFAKDRKTGDYLDEVVAPTEGRDEWISRRLQFQEICGPDDDRSQGGRSRASSMATRRVEEWFRRSQFHTAITFRGHIHLTTLDANTKPFKLPRPATPFAKMLDTDDEVTDASSYQSTYYEASLSISFDSLHDAVSGHEPAASALPRLSPGVSSWCPRSSKLSSSPRGSDSEVGRAPRLRRVGILSNSPAGRFNSKMSVAVSNAGFEAALQDAQSDRPTSLDHQNMTPVRGSVSSTSFHCSSTTLSLAETPRTPSSDWNFVATPRSLKRKRKRENLRLEYRTSQITDNNSDISSNEDPTFEFATKITTKIKPRNAIPAKDSAIWQDEDVFCICGCSAHPAHRERSECVTCDQWYHLRCVGVEHLNEHYKNKPFYCPRCMEIGVVEDAVAEGL